MNKLIIGLLLLVASTSVMAEWTRIEYSVEFDTYADFKTIRKVGAHSRMWSLYDDKTAKQLKSSLPNYLSRKTLYEYECEGDRIKYLSNFFYSGPMGSGDIIYSSDTENPKWIHVAPDTLAASQLEIACGKKENIPNVSIRKESISNETISSDFKSYPINTIYKGITVPLILDTPQARNYRTRLKEAINQPADFAGEFILARWGCGMGCVYGAAVSRKTGKVVFLPTTVCCWYGEDDKLQYQLNSNLLIANGSLNEGEEYGQFFYEFNGHEFKLIHKVPIDKEMHISKSNE